MTLCLTQLEEQARHVGDALGVKASGWTLELPMKIRSEQHSSRDWRAKHARTLKEKDAVLWAIFGAWGHRRPSPPVVVTLTRIAPRKLDTDSLAYGFKATRDAVAKWLGVDDGDESRVRWVYAPQERGKPGQYACRISIEEGTP